MIEFIPRSVKAKFYASSYHWNQCEKLEDTKVAILKAANETGVRLDDACELFKEINGKNTYGLADTGDRAIVNFFRLNWEKFARASEELLQTAKVEGNKSL